MSIFDVQHQPRAHRMVQRALASDRMPHAYLFAGREGVGREMLAWRLAQLMLCESPVVAAAGIEDAPGVTPRDACGQCADCRMVVAGTHPDAMLIHRQLVRQHPDSTVRRQKALLLGVEVIRHFLVDRAGTRPARGRARVFVVREAERMNDAAQNSLLKTLEEPPGSTFLILISSALENMLPTTRSRCQQVVFQPLPAEFVMDRLGELRPDADEAARTYAARHAEGSLGRALQMLDDEVFGYKREWGERLGRLASGGSEIPPHGLAKPFLDDAKSLGKCVADRDPDVSDTDATREGLRQLFSALADFCRDALHQCTSAAIAPVNADQPDIIAHLAADAEPGDLIRALQAIARADQHIRQNANVDLTLETLFIQLARGRLRRAAV